MTLYEIAIVVQTDDGREEERYVSAYDGWPDHLSFRTHDDDDGTTDRLRVRIPHTGREFELQFAEERRFHAMDKLEVSLPPESAI